MISFWKIRSCSKKFLLFFHSTLFQEALKVIRTWQ